MGLMNPPQKHLTKTEEEFANIANSILRFWSLTPFYRKARFKQRERSEGRKDESVWSRLHGSGLSLGWYLVVLRDAPRVIYIVQEGESPVVRDSVAVYNTKVESLSRSMTRHLLPVQEDPDATGVAKILRVI